MDVITAKWNKTEAKYSCIACSIELRLHECCHTVSLFASPAMIIQSINRSFIQCHAVSHTPVIDTWQQMMLPRVPKLQVPIQLFYQIVGFLHLHRRDKCPTLRVIFRVVRSVTMWNKSASACFHFEVWMWEMWARILTVVCAENPVVIWTANIHTPVRDTHFPRTFLISWAGSGLK